LDPTLETEFCSILYSNSAVLRVPKHPQLQGGGTEFQDAETAGENCCKCLRIVAPFRDSIHESKAAS